MLPSHQVALCQEKASWAKESGDLALYLPLPDVNGVHYLGQVT